MQATNDLRSILDAAEQAVAREDAAAAERLLREALALQETTPGSPRDEIAKTLNNLAVVCEMTGKLKDAETCYRRAFKIATASLPASDPFVTTSRENLEAFCKAQNIPPVPQFMPQPAPVAPRVTEPAPARAPAAPPAPAAAPAPAPEPAPAPRRVAPPPPRPVRAEPTPAPPPPRVPSRPLQPSRVAVASPIHTETRRGSRTILIVIALVAALVVAIVLARWLVRPGVAERAEPISQSAPVASVPPDVAAPTPTPSPGPPPEPTPQPNPIAAAPSPVAPEPEPPRATASSADVTVVSAQLCRSLTTTGAWRCEAASGTQASGRLTFYTRVASARDTVIEHRWLQDGRVRQRVELRIRANPDGFRTYSRNTIGPDRTGQWKVELRALDGRLLHEEAFVVQ